MSAVPPDPPIKVSEDITEGGRTDEAAAGDPASGHPASGEAESSSSPTLRSLPPEDEEPEPEVIAELVQEAAPVLGTGPAVEGRMRTWARQWGLPTLRKALDVAAETIRKGKLRTTPSGLIVGTMKTIEAEGGLLDESPARAKPRAPTPEAKARFQAALAARRNAREGGPS